MKQPNDTKTLDLLVEEKRGRGRPRVENAKSPAERARLYRLNKKTRPQVARPLAAAADEIQYLRSEIDDYNHLVGCLQAEVRGLQAEQATLIAERGQAFAKVKELSGALVESVTLIGSLRAKFKEVERDSYNADIRGRFAEDLCDEQVNEIARLRAELDKRDASQKRVSKKSVAVKSVASQK